MQFFVDNVRGRREVDDDGIANLETPSLRFSIIVFFILVAGVLVVADDYLMGQLETPKQFVLGGLC